MMVIRTITENAMRSTWLHCGRPPSFGIVGRQRRERRVRHCAWARPRTVSGSPGSLQAYGMEYTCVGTVALRPLHSVTT